MPRSVLFFIVGLTVGGFLIYLGSQGSYSETTPVETSTLKKETAKFAALEIPDMWPMGAPYMSKKIGDLEMVFDRQGWPSDRPKYTLNGFRVSELSSDRGEWASINTYCSMKTSCKVRDEMFRLHKGRIGCEEIKGFTEDLNWCRAIDEKYRESGEDENVTNKCREMRINAGYWRDVFVYVLPSTGKKVILKALKAKHTSSSRNLLRSLRESILLQYMRGHPYILGEAGHCFDKETNDYVMITPFMDHGNLEDIILDDNYKEKTDLRRILLWCWEMAQALDAIHSVNGGPFVHADLQPRQFMLTKDGHIKMNDFNRGKFMSWDGEEKCKYCGAKSKGRWRAPEEYTRDALNEKLDIYSTAMIYYSLFSGDKVMEDIPKDDVYERVPRGYRPEFPDGMPPELQELVMYMWHPDPAKRPSANFISKRVELIADTLEDQLDKLLVDLKYDKINPMPWGESSESAIKKMFGF